MEFGDYPLGHSMNDAKRGTERLRFFLMTEHEEQKRTDGDQAAVDLLPLLYDELRRLAAALTARLAPGQTLQPTALVHEAYLRLVRDKDPGWKGRRHFFGSAAQAMRDILIDQARRKASLKHGGQAQRIELSEGLAWIEPPSGDMLALDEAIQQLQEADARLAEIVRLRYYTGLSVEETAELVGVSVTTLKRDWRWRGPGCAEAGREAIMIRAGHGSIDPDGRWSSSQRALCHEQTIAPSMNRPQPPNTRPAGV